MDLLNSIDLDKVGKVLLASLFVVSGYQSLVGYDGFRNSVAGTGIPLPEIVAAIAIGMKFGGGVALALGIQEKLASLALMIFTLAATYFFHNPMKDPTQMTNMLKNLSIVGGLLLVFKDYF